MTTLELLQKTINIQQSKEKPSSSRPFDFVSDDYSPDNELNKLKEMFGMK